MAQRITASRVAASAAWSSAAHTRSAAAAGAGAAREFCDLLLDSQGHAAALLHAATAVDTQAVAPTGRQS